MSVPGSAPARAREPFWGYDDLALFVGAAIPSLLLAGFAVRGLRLVLPGQWISSPADLLAVQFLGYGLWFLALYALLRVRHRRPFWVSLGWTGSRRGLAASLFAGPLLALSVAALGVAMRTPEVDMPIRELLSTRWSIVLVGVFAVTLGPVCEELAFRGFLFPLVSRSFGPTAGIVIAAAPFAILHAPQYGWSWRHVLLVGLAGVAFGWVRHRTASTAAAAGMHATYNMTFFAAFLTQQGDQFGPW